MPTGVYIRSDKVRRGMSERRRSPIGTPSERWHKGRIAIRTFEGWRTRARVVFEEVFGPIPYGYVVHHLDGNPANDALDNLAIMSRSAHNRLHMNLKCPQRDRS
jgi:hypothetical protein